MNDLTIYGGMLGTSIAFDIGSIPAAYLPVQGGACAFACSPAVVSSNTTAYVSITAYTTFTSAFATLNLVDRYAVIQSIDSMGALTENWDGYGAATISSTATRAARGFVLSLPASFPAPEVSPNSNGTVSLEWESDAGRAHLEIGDSAYSFYLRRAEGSPIYRDGSLNEIGTSKAQMVGAAQCPTPTLGYTINQIHLYA
jgi:hypothetical protein